MLYFSNIKEKRLFYYIFKNKKIFNNNVIKVFKFYQLKFNQKKNYFLFLDLKEMKKKQKELLQFKNYKIKDVISIQYEKNFIINFEILFCFSIIKKKTSFLNFKMLNYFLLLHSLLNLIDKSINYPKKHQKILLISQLIDYKISYEN